MDRFLPTITHCCAYIDPNAAGWLFQLLFPIIAAITGGWLLFRKKVASIARALIGKVRKRPRGE